jgi:hypothetical protein
MVAQASRLCSVNVAHVRTLHGGQCPPYIIFHDLRVSRGLMSNSSENVPENLLLSEKDFERGGQATFTTNSLWGNFS